MPANVRAMKSANYLHLQTELSLEVCYKFLGKNKINIE